MLGQGLVDQTRNDVSKGGCTFVSRRRSYRERLIPCETGATLLHRETSASPHRSGLLSISTEIIEVRINEEGEITGSAPKSSNCFADFIMYDIVLMFV